MSFKKCEHFNALKTPPAAGACAESLPGLRSGQICKAHKGLQIRQKGLVPGRVCDMRMDHESLHSAETMSELK